MIYEIIQINECVNVYVYKENEYYSAKIMTNWFGRGWKHEEDYIKDRDGLSEMEVYGLIEYEVNPIYKEEK